MGGSGTGRHRRHVRRGGGSLLGPGMKGMLGMGALGVAIAAFDHFTFATNGIDNRERIISINSLGVHLIGRDAGS